MKMKFTGSLLVLLFIAFASISNAQCVKNPDPNGKPLFVRQGTNEPCANAIPTTMPFLTITPDARAAGMGDVGIATSADPNKMHHNQSMLAFAEEDFSVSATYTPWLADLGLNDIYLGYLSGYYKLDDLQTIGVGLRYFSYGQIDFTDDAGTIFASGKPFEMGVSLAYARKLSDNLSAALGGTWAYSDLASGQVVNGQDIKAASTVAADVSFTYKAPINLGSGDTDLAIGLAINNIGTKVNYTEGTTKDNIPTSLNLGTALIMDLDDYNRFTIGLDIHKLLVPTPIPVDAENYDVDGNDVADYREKSVIGGLFSSFGDAPNGFSEELKEYQWSVGAEYWYNDQFAVRAGYFNEHADKGNRKYLTLGAGVKYNVFGLNFSYLIATNGQNNPLNNTFRFSLIFDINALTYEEAE